jgi:hypothetical protein
MGPNKIEFRVGAVQVWLPAQAIKDKSDYV